MAQPVFEEHPLEQYLRDAGEIYELMPGASQELLQEIDIDRHLLSEPPHEDEAADMEWQPRCVAVGLNILETFLTSAKTSKPSNPFVERFKYNVISSSLLSTSVFSSHPSKSPMSIPGRLHHSRTPSLEIEPIKMDDANLSYTSNQNHGLTALAGLATIVFAGLGNRPMATLCLGAVSYLLYHMMVSSEPPTHDFTPTFTSLSELVAANSTWESTVRDALQIIEQEEARLLHLSTTPSSASSSSNALRISLHTTLQATRSQCDNVRQLLSALTCPSELSQLSEMYAPPSPMKSPLSLVGSPRPLSFPSRQTPTTPQNKRATWHASYSGLASVGSPTSAFQRRREKHRSATSTLFQGSSSPSQSNTPITPAPLSPLAHITVQSSDSEDSVPPLGDMFGSAALGLHRKQYADGLGALSTPPNMRHSTISHGSRFTTTTQTGRHPLSLFTLKQTLQGAIGAKRYACSHLLALRFNEDEEEYWENVRSVMELLTTTFADEAARLAEALEDAERQHLRDQNPTPDISQEFGRQQAQSMQWLHVGGGRVVSGGSAGFAPMPSHLSRFGAHVSAIQAALDDARDHLRECLDSLREGSPLSRQARSPLADGEESEEHKAVAAYERLRKELGVALRECGRGKQKLLDLVHPPEVMSSEDEDDLPGLGHDPSEEADEKPDPVSPSEDEGEPSSLGKRATAIVGADIDLDNALDDVAKHMLMETSLIPPIGIEQVYEADTSNVVPFTRERSKLTREERIRIMKAKREAQAQAQASSAFGGSGDGESLGLGMSKVEKWGPGGEVVQELKDVIWRVGEKRRKIQEQQLALQAEQQRQASVILCEDGEGVELVLPPLPESPSPSPRSLLPNPLIPHFS